MSSKHIQSTNECCDIAAISCGITFKPLCTLWAKILIIWKQVVT